MSREDPQLKIRLPIDLKEKIAVSASELGRSINSDVVARLEDSFQNQDKSHAQEVVLLKEQLNDVRAMLKTMKGLFSAIAAGREKEFFELMELRHPKAFESARKSSTDYSNEINDSANEFLESLKQTVIQEIKDK